MRRPRATSLLFSAAESSDVGTEVGSCRRMTDPRRPSSHVLAVWLAALGLAHAGTARADDAPRVRFGRGTWSVAAYGGWTGENSTTIVSGHAQLAFHVLDDFAVGIEASAYEIWRRGGERAAAGSGDLVLRWYAFRVGTMAFFLDGGCDGRAVGALSFGTPRPEARSRLTPREARRSRSAPRSTSRSSPALRTGDRLRGARA